MKNKKLTNSDIKKLLSVDKVANKIAKQIEPREKILEVIEKDFKVSGDDKIFVVILLIGLVIVKLVVWRPRNYTLIAYNYNEPVKNGMEVLNITSYHDSCWRYDGFSFLNQFPREYVKKLKIISFELLDSQKCAMDNTEKFFIIQKQ